MLMRFPSTHPAIDRLADLRTNALDSVTRDRIARHLRHCARCQSDLRFLTRIDGELQTSLHAAAPANVLDRAMASRSAGERRVLAATEQLRGAHSSPWLLSSIAAAIVAIAGILVVARAPDLAAVSAQSKMRLSPSEPRVGSRIDVVYTPMAGLFGRTESLFVRARLRTADDGMYAGTVPSSRVRRVATLHRQHDGTYTGSFVLPDSVVFASLVVEDESAARLDDNDSRAWEVTTYSADHRPSFDAVNQRVNDMMGRSWDEAYKSTQQLTSLYPGDIRSWTLLEFFDNAMQGETSDSLRRPYVRTIDSLTRTLHDKAGVPEPALSQVLYRAYTRAMRGTRADSAEARYWLSRVNHEYPRNTQLAQYYAVSFSRTDYEQPARMLDSLERLYTKFAPLQGPGRNVVNVAMGAVSKTKDSALYRRWHERMLTGTADSLYRTALDYAARSEFRGEGEAAIRELLAREATTLVRARGLAETPRQFAERAQNARRRLLVALGAALIADGRSREAIDTLNQAASGVWDPQIFRSLRNGYAAAGNVRDADRMAIRLAVDPRTTRDSAEAMLRVARARSGSGAVDSSIRLARDEMNARYLARSTTRTLRGSAHLVDADGERVALRNVTGGQPAVVVFWSLHCGWALQALPGIMRAAEQLHEDGVPVVFIAGEAPSSEVKTYLKEKKWTLPVYFDSASETANAFANFGTPAYYVLDGAGRIRFNSIEDDQAELLAQVGALQSR
jgi:hypothetical protein